MMSQTSSTETPTQYSLTLTVDNLKKYYVSVLAYYNYDLPTRSVTIMTGTEDYYIPLSLRHSLDTLGLFMHLLKTYKKNFVTDPKLHYPLNQITSYMTRDPKIIAKIAKLPNT